MAGEWTLVLLDLPSPSTFTSRTCKQIGTGASCTELRPCWMWKVARGNAFLASHLQPKVGSLSLLGGSLPFLHVQVGHPELEGSPELAGIG